MSNPNDQQNEMNRRIRRDRTEMILQEAMKSFAEYGYTGTTLAAIAEAVDLTGPGVLHYFPSKVHLLQGVLEYRDRQDEEKYAKLVEHNQRKARESLKIIEDLIAQNEKIPGLVQLFTVLVGESIRNDHPSHDYFVNRYRRIRAMLVEFFANLEDLHLPADADVEELANLVVAVMDGLQIQWLLDPENVDMASAFRLFARIVAGR